MSVHSESFEPVTRQLPNAKTFLDELDLVNDRWHRDGLWIFRGQNDARWSLMPSLFRQWQATQVPLDELYFVDEFLQAINKAQMPIPRNVLDYCSQWHGNLSMSRTIVRDSFDDLRTHDFTHIAYALAQHAGVPTRLLEFTYDPFVAAFFAAETTNLNKQIGYTDETLAKLLVDTIKNAGSGYEAEALLHECAVEMDRIVKLLPSDLVVWAVCVDAMHYYTSLRVLSHAIGETLNLARQKSGFVCNTHRYELESDPGDDVVWRPFDEELSRLVETAHVYKITLPFSERRELQALLTAKRYKPATITPSYELLAKLARGNVEASINRRQSESTDTT